LLVIFITSTCYVTNW